MSTNFVWSGRRRIAARVVSDARGNCAELAISEGGVGGLREIATVRLGTAGVADLVEILSETLAELRAKAGVR